MFSGHLEEVLEGLFKTQAEYDSRVLHHAITVKTAHRLFLLCGYFYRMSFSRQLQGISTDEDAVTDIICTRSNRELRALKTTYALRKFHNMVILREIFVLRVELL